MNPATKLSIVLFLLVAAAHLLRLVDQTEVLIGGSVMPQWVSLVGVIVPAGLAVGLWREARRG